MFKFFDMIGDFLGTLVDAFASLVSNLVTMFSMIAAGGVAVAEVYAFLPDIVKGVAAALVAYAIIINVLNKGG